MEAAAEVYKVLAFLLHLSADVYQPLHTFSGFDEQCRSDRGGNAVCVERVSTAKACKVNLHTLWDRGFGVFDWHAHRLIFSSKRKVIELDGSIFSMTEWRLPGPVEAEFIYQAEDLSIISDRYRLTAQKLSEDATVRALTRVQYLLQWLSKRSAIEGVQ